MDASRLVAVACLIILSAGTAQAAIVVEAENFGNHYNAGGNDIAWVSCSAASGGRAVEGFDTTGDWIEIAVTVPDTYVYVDSLRSAGLAGAESDVELKIFGAEPGGTDVTSGYHTIGLGIG